MVDHPILNPLPSDQQALVEILGECWLRNGRWPVFDYLNRRLQMLVGADATGVMARLPVARRHVVRTYTGSSLRSEAVPSWSPISASDSRLAAYTICPKPSQ